MTPAAVAPARHFTVDTYVVGQSEVRVRVTCIVADQATDAFEISAQVLRELTKHIDRPRALRMEVVDVHPIHEATIKG